MYTGAQPVRLDESDVKSERRKEFTMTQNSSLRNWWLMGTVEENQINEEVSEVLGPPDSSVSKEPTCNAEDCLQRRRPGFHLILIKWVCFFRLKWGLGLGWSQGSPSTLKCMYQKLQVNTMNLATCLKLLIKQYNHLSSSLFDLGLQEVLKPYVLLCGKFSFHTSLFNWCWFFQMNIVFFGI